MHKNLTIKKVSQFDGLYKVGRKIFEDERGIFSRLMCEDELTSFLGTSFVQVNFSHTKNKGTVRGIHFQSPPESEIKYICCVNGIVYDVAVDLRQNSKTYGAYFGSELSGLQDGLICQEVFRISGIN